MAGERYIVCIVMVAIVAFFVLKDGHSIREDIVHRLTSGKQRLMVEGILEYINRLLGEYIRALVFLSLSSFVCYVLFLSLTGASYFILLAGIAAICEFLPVVGPAAAGLVVLLVTGLSGYEHLVWFLIFWLVFRLFQDYVVSPYLMGKGVEMNSLLVLFGVVAGEPICGVTGMFFSIPLLATLPVILVRMPRVRPHHPEECGTPLPQP